MLILMLMAVILLSGNALQAQNGVLQGPSETFYATATVQERSVDEATHAVTVVDREAIDLSGVRTTTELLQGVAGVHVTTSGTRGGTVSASIRGGDPNFTFIFLDGIPLNDITDPQGGAFNLDSLPVTLVERVEIVRGPLSSFYGSTGQAGIIQLVTRRGDGEPSLEVEVGGGNASLRRMTAAVGGETQQGGDFFIGFFGEEEKERIADEAFEQWNVQGSFGIPVGDAALRWTARASSWDATDYPEASGGPIYGSGALRDSEHDELSTGLELLHGQHRFSLGWSRHELERQSPGVFPMVPPSTEATLYERSRLGWAATLLSRSGLEVAAGLDVEREEGRNESLLLLPPFLGGDVSGNYDVDRTQGGAHLQLLKRHGDLLLDLGIRADLVEDGEELSPRLGLSWRPGQGPWLWRVSAGRAFKLPSFFALASPLALGGNPELAPETSFSWDAGVERSWDAAGVRLGLNVFSSRFEDLVDFDFETFLHINRSQVDAEGAELSLAWRAPAARFSLDAALTWQETEDRATGQALLRRPDWSGMLSLSWRPNDAVTLGLDLQSVGRLPDAQIPVPELAFAPAYELLHLAASWQVHPHWQLRARLDNLLDESHETLIGFPGAGRAAALSLRYKSLR